MKKENAYEEKNIKSIKKENMKLGILFVHYIIYLCMYQHKVQLLT